ncbi:MAG: tripartite tricarboxylate transporter substrate-binding protein [bacterium]
MQPPWLPRPLQPAGRLQGLAVTSAARTHALPGVPALAEFLSGYAACTAAGIAAPRGTPAEVIALLNREVNAGLLDPKLGARLAELGATVRPGSPEAFAAFIARETERWGRVIRTTGIRPG